MDSLSANLRMLDISKASQYSNLPELNRCCGVFSTWEVQCDIHDFIFGAYDAKIFLTKYNSLKV